MGNLIFFYINGVLDSSTPAKGNLNVGKQPLAVGVESAVRPKKYFAGMVDDVRVYDRALSKEEVNELYNLEKPKSSLEKGLVAYYPFNGNAKDESGNGNDGTLSRSVWWVKKTGRGRHGKLGQAFFFDGHSTITVENHPSLDFSEALTISVWVNNAGAGSGHPGVIAN